MRGVGLYVPNKAPYPFEALREGLAAVGYGMTSPSVDAADLLVTWSPWKGTTRAALAEMFGPKRTIVVENGWLSPIRGKAYYQMALNGWNGGGTYPVDGASRWESWGLELQPARPVRPMGRKILVIGQKGLANDPRTMPTGWDLREWKAIQTAGWDCNLRAARGTMRALYDDLAWCTDVVTWSSNAVTYALLEGLPVYAAGPQVMLASACQKYSSPESLQEQGRNLREPALFDAAWCQWSEDEIRTGEPFRRLLDAA